MRILPPGAFEPDVPPLYRRRAGPLRYWLLVHVYVGIIAGVLLLLYTSRGAGSETTIHCNLSSWYVDPAFRNYAALLTKIAQRNKEVTYLNISPATWTWPIIETQGFNSYCSGLFFSLPALSSVKPGTTIQTVSPDTRTIEGLSEADAELLIRHARYGCLSLVCRTTCGAFPFILLPTRIRRGAKLDGYDLC